MACVILINVKNKNEKMEIIEGFSDNLNYEVITDLKKYVEDKYKGRFVEEEEDGGGGDSTQMEASEPVENKDIPLLTPVTQNDQMSGTVGNTSTNRNTIEREEDGYGTFIPYRDRMIEPKKENDVTSEVLVGNASIRAEIDDECVINPLSIPPEVVQGEVIDNEPHTNDTRMDVPCLDNVVDMDIDITEGRDGETEDVTGSKGSDVVPTDEKPVTSINDEPSTSTKRRSGISTKRPRHTTDDEDLKGKTGDSQTTKSIGRPPQQTSKKKKSVMDSSNGSDVISVIDSSILDDTPLTSTRRLGRSVKRPKYATDNEESDGDDDGPVSKKENSILKQQSNKKKCGDRSVTTGMKCKKCMKKFGKNIRSYCYAKRHAIRHTDLIRFKCSVKGCTYKSGAYENVTHHMKYAHKAKSFKPTEIHLTSEQEEELDKVTKECFPGFGDEYKVCEVCQVAILSSSLDQHRPKNHARIHIDFMLYKCNQQNCQYESQHFRLMTRHGKKTHGIETMSKEDTEIELTDDQKKEIDDMFKKCFPDEEDID